MFDTWNDHRMAMATAAFCMLGEVEIRNPDVEEMWYPEFLERCIARREVCSY